MNNKQQRDRVATALIALRRFKALGADIGLYGWSGSYALRDQIKQDGKAGLLRKYGVCHACWERDFISVPVFKKSDSKEFIVKCLLAYFRAEGDEQALTRLL